MKVNIERMYAGTVSPTTVVVYRKAWDKYVEFAGSEEKALLPSTYADFRAHLINDTQYARKTINTYMASIRSVVSYLNERGDVADSTRQGFYNIKLLRHNMLRGRGNLVTPTRIEPEQMRRICNQPVPSLHDSHGAFVRAVLLVMATSGLRVSEVAGLRVDSICEEEGGYMLRNVVTKGNKLHDVPISPEAYNAIQDWLYQRPIQSDYVFNGFIVNDEGVVLWSDTHANKSYLYKVTRMAAEAAGIRGVKPHDIRKFVGTQLAKSDVRIAQKVLGHSSLDITMRTYVLDETPHGVTNDLFAMSPLLLLAYVLPDFAANNLANENLTDLIHLGYAFLGKILFGI